MESKIIVTGKLRELVIVERDNIQVRAECDPSGHVQADSVRIVNIEGDKAHEVVCWNINEIEEDIIDSDIDHLTAFNAMLSAIEMVANGDYRKQVLSKVDPKPG